MKKQLFTTIFIIFFSLQPNGLKAQSIDNKTQDLDIYGLVYLDENQNGIRDGYEKGIGGVSLIYDGSKKAVTNASGKFHIKFKTQREFKKLTAFLPSIPPGADFTSSPVISINRKLGVRRNIEIGIYYESKKINLSPIQLKKKRKESQSNQDQFQIKIDGSDVYIENQKLQTKLSGHGKKIELKKYKLNHSLLPVNYDENKLRDIARYILEQRKDIKNVELQYQGNIKKRQQIKNLINEVRLSLLKLGVNKKLITSNITDGKEEFNIKIIPKQTAMLCQVTIGEKVYNINVSGESYIPFTNLPNVRAKLVCPSGRLSFISPWKSKYKKETQNNKELVLYHAPYLNKSQDLDIFFEFKSDAEKLKVNQDILQKDKDGFFRYVYSGHRAYNELNINEIFKQDKTKNYRYGFKLFSPSDHLIEVKSFYTRKDSESDAFDSSYKIDRVNQYQITYAYTTKKDWQFLGSYKSDIRESTVKGLTGKSVTAKHFEYLGLLGKNFRFKSHDYHSAQYALYLGLIHKSFNPGNLSAIFFPKDFTQPILRGEILFNEVFERILDIKLYSDYGFSFDFDNYFYRFGLETHFWLNQLGRVLDFGSTFIYYDRYKYFQDFKLVLGIDTEELNTETKNFSGSSTKDQMYSTYIGVKASF